MTISQIHSVQQYLEELQRLSVDLPFGERTELVASIQEHLADAEARGELSAALSRLGTPAEVARAAHADSLAAPSPKPVPWGAWSVLIALAGTIVGFTLLGATLSVTARFDEDADWNLHPALALLAVVAGALTGILVSVVIVGSRRWRPSQKVSLIALWVGVMLLALIGYEVAAAAAPGVGFAIAGLQILLGGLAVLAAVPLTLRTTR